MRYRITHRTAYTYATPVHESFNEVRLRPASDEHQTCLDFGLAIDPPATVIVFDDYYGNSVHDFSVPYLHDHLSIEATSDVVTFADVDQPLSGPGRNEPDRSPPVAGLAGDKAFADDHAEFLFPSTYVACDETTAGLTQELLSRDLTASAYAFLREAATYVRERLAYKVGSTTVHSNVAEVLAGGSGVCQDFSHLLIDLCRHAGLPARYVSGYLGDVAESEASHAWVEAFVPPYGWVGVDPTSGGPCTGRHVKIAVGRDYADVTVVRGTYRGGMFAELDVAVRSEVVGDLRGIALNTGRRRGELIQYQTLGAMKQLQRLGAMSQSLGGMTQSMENARGTNLDWPASMR
ncbi:MAG: transglutaminase family protein, partial [Chloroflexia bacterium]|nr:transglutaminase family protein [Chloroflexia bacterium]